MLWLRGHEGLVHSLAFSPTEDLLVSAAGQGKTVSLWDLSTGKRSQILRGAAERIADVAIASSGTPVLAIDYNKNILAWETETGELLPDVPDRGSIAEQIVLPTTQLIVVRYPAHPVIHKFDSWSTSLEMLELPDEFLLQFRRGTIAADGEHWVMIGDRSLAIIKESNLQQAVVTIPHSESMGTRFEVARLSPDGSRFAVGGTNGLVALWDLDRETHVNTWDWELGTIGSLMFSLDGTRLAAGGDKEIVVWDLD